MTDQDAMKLALFALDIVKIHYTQSRHINEAISALKERLAQETALQSLHDENKRLGLYHDAYAEQEPVAWMWDVKNGGGYTSRGVGLRQTSIPFAKHTPLYTHPPKREWVGLTDAEIKAFDTWHDNREEEVGWCNPSEIVAYIEAKLKEKNK